MCLVGEINEQLKPLDNSRGEATIYNFRKTNCLKPPKPNLDYIKKSIAYQGATIWNSLDNSTRAAENLSVFKRHLTKSKVLKESY